MTTSFVLLALIGSTRSISFNHKRIVDGNLTRRESVWYFKGTGRPCIISALVGSLHLCLETHFSTQQCEAERLYHYRITDALGYVIAACRAHEIRGNTIS